MFQPVPVLLITLLLGMTAAAQSPAPARQRVERRLTPSAAPTHASPEVHLAPGVTTTLVTDAPVRSASLELDSQERLGLRLRLEDGTVVALALTSSPSRSDGQVDVQRPLSDEALRAELAETQARLAALQARCAQEALVELILSEDLDDKGVLGRGIGRDPPAGGTGLQLIEGMGYRATAWAVVDVTLRLASQGAPWELGEVRLVSPEGLTVQAVPVRPTRPRLAPGEEVRVILRTPKPHWKAGTKFRLEVSNGSGPPLFLGRVEL